MCISEWLIEEEGFHTVSQTQREIFLATSTDSVDFAADVSPSAKIATFTDSPVNEILVDIAA